MFNSILWILLGILLQSGSMLIQVWLIRTPKEEWDSIMKNQGQDLDKVIRRRQGLKSIAFSLVAIAIVLQGYGIWLNQFDNFEQLSPIWEEISKIKTQLGN